MHATTFCSINPMTLNANCKYCFHLLITTKDGSTFMQPNVFSLSISFTDFRIILPALHSWNIGITVVLLGIK